MLRTSPQRRSMTQRRHARVSRAPPNQSTMKNAIFTLRRVFGAGASSARTRCNKNRARLRGGTAGVIARRKDIAVDGHCPDGAQRTRCTARQTARRCSPNCGLGTRTGGRGREYGSGSTGLSSRGTLSGVPAIGSSRRDNPLHMTAAIAIATRAGLRIIQFSFGVMSHRISLVIGPVGWPPKPCKRSPGRCRALLQCPWRRASPCAFSSRTSGPV